MTGGRISFPFLRLEEHFITAGAWRYRLGDGETRELGDTLPGWDYSQGITLSRVIGVKTREAAREAGLDVDGTSFRLIISAGTGESERYRRTMCSRPLASTEDSFESELSFAVPGQSLSKNLFITTEILLEQPGKSNSRLAASRQGSRLWQDRHVVALEGEMGRFPMEAIDFIEAFPGQHRDSSLWYLDWDPGAVSSAFLGTVRLYLNTRQEIFIERVESGDPVTLSSIMSGVAVQMAATLLQVSEFSEYYPEFEEGTVGAVVAGWLDSAFPGKDLKYLQEIGQNQPGLFYAALQNTLMFDDE